VSSFLIIFISLATGYLIQLLVKKSILSLPFSLGKIRKFLQELAMLFFMPIKLYRSLLDDGFSSDNAPSFSAVRRF